MKYKFNKWWGLGLGILDLVFLILALIIFSLVEKNIDGEISIWIGLPILCLVHLPFWFLAGYWAEKSLIEEDEQKKKKNRINLFRFLYCLKINVENLKWETVELDKLIPRNFI